MTSYSPCDWPVDYSGCGSCAALDGLPPEKKAAFEQFAADILWSWTNRVFGLCEVALRPCKTGCTGVGRPSTFWGRGPYPWVEAIGSNALWVPMLWDGKWYNMSCGCAGTCSCSMEGPTSLALPGPVASVTQVLVDGVLLDPSAYRVMYKRYLVRTDGGVWPSCQNLEALPTEPDTFEVTYMRGLEVPVGGQLSAGVLACELAKAFCKDATCQLPQRIQTVTREGVTVTLMDSFEDLKNGATGIWAIDSWVASVNKPRPFSSVRSVDVNPKAGAQWSLT